MHGEVDVEEIERVARYFTGLIYQRPPVRSNVKRTLRVRRVRRLEVLEKVDRLVLVRISCDAGTYVRKLCHDMGVLLGTGAHMRELRRTRSGPFSEDTSHTLHEISEAVYAWRCLGEEEMLRKIVMPVEVAVCRLPKIVLRQSAVAAVANGAYLAIPGVMAFTRDAKRGSMVALMTPKAELVALGRIEESPEALAKRGRGVVARPERVIMSPEAYPRAWRSSGELGRNP